MMTRERTLLETITIEIKRPDMLAHVENDTICILVLFVISLIAINLYRVPTISLVGAGIVTTTPTLASKNIVLSSDDVNVVFDVKYLTVCFPICAPFTKNPPSPVGSNSWTNPWVEL